MINTSTKFQQQIAICNIHADRIQIALKHIEPLLPLTKERVLHLSDEELGFLELLFSRIGKLQDTIGKHIFPLTLELLGEGSESQSMIDRLNRLEKMNFIKDTSFWQYLRNVRNEITHEYENKPDLQAEKILHAVESAKSLLKVWTNYMQVAQTHKTLTF